jgi:hypothetical protein
VLNAVRHRSLLPVTVHQQQTDRDSREKQRHERAPDEEREDSLSGASHIEFIVPARWRRAICDLAELMGGDRSTRTADAP